MEAPSVAHMAGVAAFVAHISAAAVKAVGMTVMVEGSTVVVL